MTAPLAVVTGASSGIGLELARQFTAHGFDVVACADEPVPVAEIGGSVTVVQADLRTSEGVERLWDVLHADGRPVTAAALNAGVGRGEAFVDQALEDVLSVIDLNVRSTVHLAWLLLGEMVANDEGRVLVTSSIASMLPGAYQAVYNASKSFLQSWVQGVQGELDDTQVTLTSLMPGPTETNFFLRAGMADDTLMGRAPKDDAAKVAAQGFEAMMAGRRRVVGGGVATKLQTVGARVLPDQAKSALHRVVARPRR